MAHDSTLSSGTDQRASADVSNIEVITKDELKTGQLTHQSDEDGKVEAESTRQEQDVPKKKKKKSKRSGASKGLHAPTGFEEFYADAPLTPAEHAEEQQIYDPSLPFTQRILTAIQRFERRRKMGSEQRDIFYKYLKYGGMTTGPNMFQGGRSKADLGGMDKDEIAVAFSQISISADKDDVGAESSAWAVDFEGVMKGFLSRRAPYYYGFEVRSQVDIIVRVLSNFMNYLLHHDVCPEYAGDMLAARKVCSVAGVELWACAEAQRWLPGDFNIACSTLFDGIYAEMYDGVTTWMPEHPGVSAYVGMTADVAREVIKFAVAGAASEDIYQAWYEMALENSIKVVEVHKATGFEIVAIDQVDPATKTFYKEQSTDYRPVGRISAKPWTNPDGPPEDLTREEKALLQNKTDKAKDGVSDISNSAETEEPAYEFLIEEVILQHLFVGMKIEATIRKLNCGIWFFDEILSALPSFDTYLCNELMVGWKEPRAVEGRVGKEEDDIGADE